jgi:glycosyltransferase involved in cell wall biosynthesis
MTTLLSHEWLAPIGGSENVFEELIKAYPEADTLCLWNDAPDRFSAVTGETWLARTPLRRSKPASLPFMSSAWKQIDLGPYDRVISSSHAFGHHLAGNAARAGRKAFAYVHSPARYIWAPEHDHRGRGRIATIGAKPLQAIDRSGTHPDVHYAANSEFVRDRIRASWGRDANVIYPPVDIERITSVTSWRDRLNETDSDIADGLPDTFIFGASRLIEYKRLDLTIEIGSGLGLPVVIAGSGPDEPRLRELASTTATPVYFVGRISDELLFSLYSAATLFVFLAVEDFGIMPVEAIASGTPVLVNEVGGAAEIVRHTSGGRVATLSDPGSLVASAAEAITADMAAAAERVAMFNLNSFSNNVHRWTQSDSGDRR